MNIKRQFGRFAGKLILFTFLIAGLSYVIFKLYPSLPFPDVLPWLLVYFFVFTLLVHGVMIMAAQDKSELSITYFMATITGKLIVSLVVVAALAYLFQNQLLELVIWFFILYIIFTAFEIISLLPILQANNEAK